MIKYNHNRQMYDKLFNFSRDKILKNHLLLSVLAAVFIVGIFGHQGAFASDMTFTTDTTISTSMTIADGETWTVNNGVTLTINPGVTITVENGGSIVNDGNTFNFGYIFNRGSILNSQFIMNTVSASIVNQNSIINPGHIENVGTINFASQGEVINPGTIFNTGTISPGNLLIFDPSHSIFINSGDLITFNEIQNVGYIIVNCGNVIGPVLNPVVDCTTDALIDLVENSFLEANVEKSLTGPLKIVSKIMNDNNSNNDHVACKKLDSFISRVESKESSGDLSSIFAGKFMRFAEAIKDDFGCQAA